ncbi:MAG: hypothetical protein AMJ79_02520 [Phycisphaerae bacterium SM23_30]|nr:MAG: hypothetical protein AMJ79_02520 [Phycisphaerae bacterium SM23_30]
MVKKPQRSIEEIFREDNRYPLEAVQFVREGLNHAVAKFHRQGAQTGTVRHVSGAQLCAGLRELALKRWGLMARSVLAKWNIKRTRDFGEIVFLLVENGWMQKEPQDRIEDFEDVYDFQKAFQRGFEMSPDS